ncbi:MAG: hypothetical protein MRY77_11350, partial [Rhodobacteraceae bacterium]|nr:hypothetical protein [Paracoccaceae bacterium]
FVRPLPVLSFSELLVSSPVLGHLNRESGFWQATQEIDLESQVWDRTKNARDFSRARSVSFAEETVSQ